MWKRSPSAPELSVVVVLFLAACADDPTQPLAERSGGGTIDAQEVQGSDAVFLEIAREVPGFGGMFYDDDGRLNVFIREPELDVEGSNEIVRQLDESLRLRSWELPSRDRIVLRGAEYDFQQLATWHRNTVPALSIKGVVFTHIDHTRNTLTIGIEAEVSPARIERVLDQVGVPREAVSIQSAEPIRLFNGHDLQSTIRPVAGGLQIHFDAFLCTFGFNVIRDDVQHWVTNSHCSTDRGTIGTLYFQAIALDGADTFIGVEVEDPPFFIAGPCPLGRLCRFSDAAVALASDAVGATFKQGAIYRTQGGPGSLEIDFDRRTGHFFKIVDDDPSTAVGQRLNKVGRTTGWTQSRVTSTCANVNVADTQITMLCQALVEADDRIAGPGDSGSPFFRTIPERASPNSPHNDVELHGILWGGNATGTLVVFSPIQNLRLELAPFSAVAPEDF